MFQLKEKKFLKLLDLTPAEIEGLLDLAAELKAQKKAGISHRLFEGKNVALIFEKTSTRTRCAFEVAAHELGMQCTYLDPRCWAACLTASNTAATASRSSRICGGIPACRSGTA